MQTFLPFPSFVQTAKCLDDRRLGKQIVEARQIYDILFRPDISRATVAQQHHPIVYLWRHCIHKSDCLLRGYIHILNAEWRSRFNSNHKSADDVFAGGIEFQLYAPLPAAFHYAHRCSLLAKDISHYIDYFVPPPAGVINPLWYHHPTRRWYTGRLSSPKSLHMWPAGEEPTINEWLDDCKHRGLFDPKPRVVAPTNKI